MNDLLLAYVCSFANTHAQSDDVNLDLARSFEGLDAWGNDLVHADSGTRDATAEALLYMGEEVIPSLVELLDEPDEQIRDLAQTVLDRLGYVAPV